MFEITKSTRGICPSCGAKARVVHQGKKDIFYKEQCIEIDSCVVYKCTDTSCKKKKVYIPLNLKKQIINAKRDIDGLLTTEDFLFIRNHLNLSTESISRILELPESIYKSIEQGDQVQPMYLENEVRHLYASGIQNRKQAV